MQKNRAQLPRTPGLHNLPELSAEMTKAGLKNPSRTEERAKPQVKTHITKEHIAMEDEEDMDIGL